MAVAHGAGLDTVHLDGTTCRWQTDPNGVRSKLNMLQNTDNSWIYVLFFDISASGSVAMHLFIIGRIAYAMPVV